MLDTVIIRTALREIVRSAKCSRRQVACLIYTPAGLCLGYGANALPEELGDCRAGDCPRGRMSYEDVPAFSDYSAAAGVGSCAAVHAEVAAIRRAEELSLRLTGTPSGLLAHATAYITCEPCLGCVYALNSVNLRHVVVDIT